MNAKAINIDASDLRLRMINWVNLTDREQRAVMAASELAHDSSYIPIIAAEIMQQFNPVKHPQHPEPEFTI